MAVVLTRPRQEGERWAERLRERGLEPLLLPLIAIDPPADLQPLRAAAARLASYAAVMFVSANAVQGVFSVAARFEGPRAWAPGLATRDALRAAGVPPERIDTPPEDAEQFDSEAWAQVAGNRGATVFAGAGGDSEGRSRDATGWPAGGAAGRRSKRLRPPNCRRGAGARAAGAPRRRGRLAVALQSSEPRPTSSACCGQPWGAAGAIAPHPRIAQAVGALASAACANRAALRRVVASIESAG